MDEGDGCSDGMGSSPKRNCEILVMAMDPCRRLSSTSRRTGSHGFMERAVGASTLLQLWWLAREYGSDAVDFVEELWCRLLLPEAWA